MSRQGKNFAIGLAGVGFEVVFIAAAALKAPTPVWVLALLIGAGLILAAFVVGEPAEEASQSGAKQTGTRAKGGEGTGDVRGNIFGDNATINIDKGPTPDPFAGKKLLTSSLADLCGLYRDQTKVQADRLAEAYLGGWLRVDGKVNDVNQTQVSPLTPRAESEYWVTLVVDGTWVYLTFPKNEDEHVIRLKKGETIHVVGRLANLGASAVDLADCEFVGA